MGLKNQHGVALIVALVFLIALTAVAAALMSSSTLDVKMAGASEEKVIATQQAIGTIDEVVVSQVTKVDGRNNFSLGVGNYPFDAQTTIERTSAQILLNNPNDLETDCPASRAASSVQEFKCNYLQVQVFKVYGRSNANRIDVRAGIAQQLININR